MRKTFKSSSRTKKHARVQNRPKKLRAVLRIIVKTIAWSALCLLLLILALRWIPAPTSAFMIVRHAENLFSASQDHLAYTWISRQHIPEHMALAIVAAEDQNFPHHFGFDLNAITRAMEHNKRGKSLRGASTISQQVAKNLFLWSGRSYTRKGLEAGLTTIIEILWPKERILEMYLNIAEFGPNTYGVNAAAKRFFGKAPKDLTRFEVALLAATLPNPEKFSPVRPSPYVLRRATWIQTQMRQLGHEHITWP